jgi:hypothetical protein
MLLAAVTVVLGVGAALTITLRPSSQPAVRADGELLPAPTPTVAPPRLGARADADAQISALPGLKTAVSAVEAGDLEALMSQLRFVEYRCTLPGSKGGPAPFCKDAESQESTVYLLFPEQISVTRYFDEATVRKFLGALLASRPRLELVSRDADGTFYISFAVDPSPNPVETPDKASVYDSFGLGVAADGTAPVLWFERRFRSYTPMDLIRDYERTGPRFEIWFVSPELEAREEAKHTAQTAGEKDPPPTSKR